jgi:uncharacterized protein YegL
VTDPNKTAIIFVIDQSGSMAPRANDVRGGFQTFVDEQKKVPGDCSMSLTFFSENPRVVFTDLPLTEVRELTYAPMGNTALYDAVGDTIEAVGKRLSELPEDKRPGKVLFCIMTDGEENASRMFPKNRIKEMIAHQTSKYGWVFNFMGCGLEAMAEGANLGIALDCSLQFGGSKTAVAFHMHSSNATSYRKGLTRGMSYSADQRASAT